MAKRKSSRNLFDDARRRHGGTPKGARLSDNRKLNTRRYRAASTPKARKKLADLRKLRQELGPVAWLRWVKFGELPAPEHHHSAPQRVPNVTATNALKRDVVARTGDIIEDARALYNATCEDLRYPTNEPLTVEEVAEALADMEVIALLVGIISNQLF